MATQPAQAAATADAACGDAGNEVQPQTSEAVLASLLDQMSTPPTESDASGGDGASDGATDGGDSAAADAGGDAAPDGSSSGAESDGGTGADADPNAAADAAAEPDPDADADAAADAKPGSKNFRGRWDHLNEQERRVVELTTKRGLSLTEAYRAVYGTASPEARQAHEADADPVAAVDAQIQQTQATITALDQEFAQVRFTDLERAEAITKEVRAAEKKLGTLEATKTEVSKGRDTQAQARVQTAFQQAEVRAIAEFPDAFAEVDGEPGRFVFNTETDLGRATEAEFAFLKASGSVILRNPNCLPLVVARVAGLRGIKPVAKTAADAPVEAAAHSTSEAVAAAPAAKATAKTAAAAAPAVVATPAAKRVARPVAAGGATPPEQSANAITAAALASNDPEQLLAAMREQGVQWTDVMAQGGRAGR